MFLLNLLTSDLVWYLSILAASILLSVIIGYKVGYSTGWEDCYINRNNIKDHVRYQIVPIDERYPFVRVEYEDEKDRSEDILETENIA